MCLCFEDSSAHDIIFLMQHFGEHLTIDGYGGSAALLDDPQLILSTLQNLPGMLDMHILAPAQIFRAEGNQSKDPGGWSGYVIIMESHISIHTFPKRGFLSADIYTCQNGLATEKAISIIKDAFALKDIETNFLRRGTRYPDKDLL